ncbi:glycosyltransferase [Paenarthrobacter nicotinovorans]|uniref:glycosyltransferase n=1 Tax=Paenarthrobacter nicotinovorans TaxID=29320 RepID=UPI00278B529B|nr:glycosyltransferase [Paenarthrobacter nicotinovorans]MDP9934152.1 glycosyltransferase involved in cell wall biosynthesis [Paenarthrobacter nicotinovorans]
MKPAHPTGAVIIPAHNEAGVIGRTLDSLEEVISWGTVDVVVACNGCVDGTEDIASRCKGVSVLRVGEASKTAALNAADQVTLRWPRLYLDADIEVSAAALRSVFAALERPDLLAARPAYRYDTQGASLWVRAYYRARGRIPSNSSGLWGAGAYALNRAGHERLGSFPSVTGDDYYVDRLFSAQEKIVLPTEPVVVRTPRTSAALLSVLRRTYRGNAEQDLASGGVTSGRTVRELLSSVRGPWTAFDAAVYVAFAGAGRRKMRRSSGAWERDNTSR